MPAVELEIPYSTRPKEQGLVERCGAPDAWPVALVRRGALRRRSLEVVDRDGGAHVLDAGSRPRLARTIRELGRSYSELTLTVAGGPPPAAAEPLSARALAERVAADGLPPGGRFFVRWDPPPERRVPDVHGEEAVDPAWDRIEAWFAEHFPAGAEVFAPGADDAAVADAERHVGTPFGAALRRSLRRHDGQDDGAPFVVEGKWLLAVEEMVSSRDATLEIGAADGIDIPSWDARLLPVARDDTGGAVAIDLENGAVCVTQYEEPDPEVIAPSFEAWLTLWADELEAGEQTLDDAENGGGVQMTWLVRRDD